MAEDVAEQWTDEAGRRGVALSSPGAWLLHALVSPASLLVVALLVHVAGRIAAFCMPIKLDSFYYTISAYRLWRAGAIFEDLIPDKPPGQALLTGWVYHLWPGEPSRLAMIPVESAFMLAAYGVFWWLARRLFGSPLAAGLTLFFVIAHNHYNGLETITDGFNLGENYLMLPTLLAVAAHLTIASPIKRGLARGLAMGVALSIKQASVGLAAAFLLHGLLSSIRSKTYRQAGVAGGLTVIGIGLAWSPMLVFLGLHGWLGDHLRELAALSGEHAAIMPIAWPPWHNLVPLVPLAWWIVVGAVVRLTSKRAGAVGKSRGSEGWLVGFLLCWLAIEAVGVWSMTKPGTHYYQQVVSPMALLAGLAIAALRSDTGRRWAASERETTWRWLGATTATLALLAAMPVLAAGSMRVYKFDPRVEVVEFAQWQATWSPSRAADHLPQRAKP
ncbi:MAG: DUF2029 domain-containing protein [Phycisphaerae bacterium]|nr:DUF2029 domain-containing protein [Phycisphaerae bacterium]